MLLEELEEYHASMALQLHHGAGVSICVRRTLVPSLVAGVVRRPCGVLILTGAFLVSRGGGLPGLGRNRVAAEKYVQVQHDFVFGCLCPAG